LSLHVPPINS